MRHWQQERRKREGSLYRAGITPVMELPWQELQQETDRRVEHWCVEWQVEVNY